MKATLTPRALPAPLFLFVLLQACQDESTLLATVDPQSTAGTSGQMAAAGMSAGGTATSGGATGETGGSPSAGGPSETGGIGGQGGQGEQGGGMESQAGSETGRGGSSGAGAVAGAGGTETGEGGASNAGSTGACTVVGDCSAKIAHVNETWGPAVACPDGPGPNVCTALVEGFCCPHYVADPDSAETLCYLEAVQDAKAAGCICASGAPCIEFQTGCSAVGEAMRCQAL